MIGYIIWLVCLLLVGTMWVCYGAHTLFWSCPVAIVIIVITEILIWAENLRK